MPDLPAIPLIDGGPLELMRAEPERLADLIRTAERAYTRPAIALGDAVSRRWLERVDHTHLDELRAVAAALGRPGAYLLNLSYEWACTSGVAADPAGGSRLLRVLDWAMPGLGRNLVVARQKGPAGDFLNLTWPGFTGVLTALAPGRFAAAVNQPPMRAHGLTPPLDWAVNKTRMWRSRAQTPAHLLRRAFETCAGYAEAREMLVATPICLPVLYTLSGTAAGEGCVIERTETAAAVHEAPAAIANHWLDMPDKGRPRGWQSPVRLRRMRDLAGIGGDDLAWMEPPIRNPDSRLAAYLNAAAGRLRVQGWEPDGPATRVFRLG